MIKLASEFKKLIGKRITWNERLSDMYATPRTGVVEEVKGRNIKIDGDWKYFDRFSPLKYAVVVEDNKI